MKIIPNDENSNFAFDVGRRLISAGHKAYLAGGCVRDQLLGRQPQDYDIATSARPEEVEGLFSKTLSIGKNFGIIVVIHGHQKVEIATFRKDGEYKDGRHPETIIYGTELEDAERRDFTINALFYDMQTEQIVDHVNGQVDIQKKLIRAVGRPEDRFQEDHLRVLRALRFAAQLNFEIEQSTWASIVNARQSVLTVSRERIRDEFVKAAKFNLPLFLNLIKRSKLNEVLLKDFTLASDFPPPIEASMAGILLSVLWNCPADEQIWQKRWNEEWKLSRDEHSRLRFWLDWVPRFKCFSEVREGEKIDMALKPEGQALLQWLVKCSLVPHIGSEVKKLLEEEPRAPFLKGGDVLNISPDKRATVLKEVWYLQLENQIKSREDALIWINKC